MVRSTSKMLGKNIFAKFDEHHEVRNKWPYLVFYDCYAPSMILLEQCIKQGSLAGSQEAGDDLYGRYHKVISLSM
jgi:hypothetical protein